MRRRGPDSQHLSTCSQGRVSAQGHPPPSFSPQGTLAQVSRVQGFCLRLQGDSQTQAPLKELTDKKAPGWSPGTRRCQEVREGWERA